MVRIGIVTGGAQGIGKGIVQHLIAEGWRVASIDKDGAAARALATDMPTDRLLSLQADVGDEAGVADAFAAIGQWLDGDEAPGIDLLVSNAGLADPVSGPIERLSLKDWRQWQDSHVTGAFLMTRAAVPLLRARKGSIVLMASTRAIQSEPQCEAYAAAKGALLALNHALAISLGPDIRCNAILPGWIETGPWAKPVSYTHLTLPTKA